MANGGLSAEQIEAIRRAMRQRSRGSSDPNAPMNSEGRRPDYSPPLPVPKPKPKRTRKKQRGRRGDGAITKGGTRGRNR